MKNIVVFGGGNGSAEILQALKFLDSDYNISAIISVSDSGGSSGRLRDEFGTLPPGDVLRAVLALSPLDYETVLKPLFYSNRFSNLGKLSDHNLGNVFLTLAAQYGGDFVQAVRALETAVQSVGTVYPATLDNTQLVAQLRDGNSIVGESNIDRPTSRESRIDRVSLEPGGVFLAQAVEVVHSADVIFLGPGSLYTSLIPSLLPVGAKEAIALSPAKLIYIAGNKYERQGEAGPEKLSEFVSELENYLPRSIDTVVFNQFDLNSEQEIFYQKKNLSQVMFDPENLRTKKIFALPFEKNTGGTDPVQLGKIIEQCI